MVKSHTSASATYLSFFTYQYKKLWCYDTVNERKYSRSPKSSCFTKEGFFSDFIEKENQKFEKNWNPLMKKIKKYFSQEESDPLSRKDLSLFLMAFANLIARKPEIDNDLCYRLSGNFSDTEKRNYFLPKLTKYFSLGEHELKIMEIPKALQLKFLTSDNPCITIRMHVDSIVPIHILPLSPQICVFNIQKSAKEKGKILFNLPDKSVSQALQSIINIDRTGQSMLNFVDQVNYQEISNAKRFIIADEEKIFQKYQLI